MLTKRRHYDSEQILSHILTGTCTISVSLTILSIVKILSLPYAASLSKNCSVTALNFGH